MADAAHGDTALERRLGGIFDDEQINVAVACGLAVRVRTEENNFLGAIFFLEPRDNIINNVARM